MAIISRFAGMYDVSAYAYGVNSNAPAALQVITGSTGTGSYTLTCQPKASVNPDQASCVPTTNTPITVGNGSNAETVTPSAVSFDTLGNILITATFGSAHGAGDQVRSGTVGLQEALNAAGTASGGQVIVSPSWARLGGTQAMIEAAIVPANVSIRDNRYGDPDDSGTTVTLTNTQILAMATTAVEILPAPNALSYWRVVNADLVNLNTGTAYTGGSAITVGYGTAVSTNALSGTIAATFLTTPTSTEVIQVPGGLLAATAGSAVLGKGVYIANATTAFAAGAGTLQVTVNAALITT